MGPSSDFPGKEKRELSEVTFKGGCRELPLFFQDGSLPVDGGSVSGQVLSPTPMVIDKADFLAYVKHDGQKAGDAKVPTHLWSFFFGESFLLYFGSESGTCVDWKREHTNVYRRYNWRRREGILEGREKTFGGFR